MKEVRRIIKGVKDLIIKLDLEAEGYYFEIIRILSLIERELAKRPVDISNDKFGVEGVLNRNSTPEQFFEDIEVTDPSYLLSNLVSSYYSVAEKIELCIQKISSIRKTNNLANSLNNIEKQLPKLDTATKI